MVLITLSDETRWRSSPCKAREGDGDGLDAAEGVALDAGI